MCAGATNSAVSKPTFAAGPGVVNISMLVSRPEFRENLRLSASATAAPVMATASATATTVLEVEDETVEPAGALSTAHAPLQLTH
eukprot:m.138503 g.138503  ORF g.138503 m.138503 type:complete len:85 (-) comp11485_c0_seq1:443-697(-)